MKALSFEIEGVSTYGLVTSAGIRAASTSFRQQFPDLKAVLTAGTLDNLRANLAPIVHSSNDIHYLPLIGKPDKILCVGVNYRPHIAEMGRQVPSHPVLFVRFPGSLVGHEEAVIKPRASEQFDFEGELAIVIGRNARAVARDEVADVIAGYTCFMDGSVRDWQSHTHQFTAGKNFARSGAIGPYLATADEVPDLPGLVLSTRVNAIEMQRARLGDLLFDIPALIEYCSTFTELLPGDIIATGTPGGVGAARKPPVWLQAADRVEVDLGPIGTLRNTVADE
ncbi:MAG TPA: fumarylacetoacetate hydrolase family protein [Woeseiaceae bacterium]|nr:fumarylacetoacetate hydrolase family protein [Woeseiaceae bacterium]